MLNNAGDTVLHAAATAACRTSPFAAQPSF